jgi:anti-sigma regulatory factor (Ser/Thr protein kinase)
VSEPLVRLSFPSQTRLLGLVRGVVTELALQAGLDPEAAEQVALAVEEAATNVIEHAYGGAPDRPVELLADVQAGELVIELLDRGREVDPRTVPSVDLERYRRERRRGGLGLHLMGRIMDTVSFARREGCNVCRLTRRLAGPEP